MLHWERRLFLCHSMARNMGMLSARRMLSSAHEMRGNRVGPHCTPHSLPVATSQSRHNSVSTKVVKWVGLLPWPCCTPTFRFKGAMSMPDIST